MSAGTASAANRYVECPQIIRGAECGFTGSVGLGSWIISAVYRDAALPDHPTYLVVGGRYGSPPYVVGDPGWFAVPELKRYAGIAEVQGPAVNAFVERGWQSIHLTGSRR